MSLNVPREIQKMAFAVLIFSEGFGSSSKAALKESFAKKWTISRKREKKVRHKILIPLVQWLVTSPFRLRDFQLGGER